MATPDASWTIEHLSIGGAVAVTGFHSRELALQHLEKHYMSPSERWEAINGGKSVLAHRSRLEQLARDARNGDSSAATELGKLRDGLIEDYVATVKRVTGSRGSIIAGCLCRHRPHPMAPSLPRICVVSNFGVFVAFDRSGRVSELCTAMRPLNKGWSAPPPSPRDFVKGAMDQLALAAMRGSRASSAGREGPGRSGKDGKRHALH